MRFVEGRRDQRGCFIIAPRPREQHICNSCVSLQRRKNNGQCFRSRARNCLNLLFLALFLLVAFCSVVVVVEGHNHELIFPSNDEYDPMAFHPDTAIAFGSGAPYGGYSRASRSRLAKLPIRLVGEAQFDSVNRGRSSTMDSTMVAEEEDETSRVTSTDENENEEEDEQQNGEYYFYIRDGEGRLFACAVHHEDDVHSQSLEESVFDDVILAGEEPPSSLSSHTPNDKDAASGKARGKTSTASENTNQMDEITRLVNSAMAGDGVVFGNLGDVLGGGGGLGGLDNNNNNDIGNVVAEMIRDALENEGIVGDALEGVQIDIEQLDIDVLTTGEDGEFDPNDEDGLANIISNALQQRVAEQQQRNGGVGRGGQQQRHGGAGGVGGGPLVGGIVIGGGGGKTGGTGNGNKGGGGGDAINVGINMKEMDRISQQLQGVCAQVHQGYWSYEWCHKKAVKQFHVTAKANKEKPGQFHYNIDTVIRLGKYQSELPKMSFMNGYGLNDIIHGNSGGTSDPITIAAPKGKESSSSKATDWASVKLVQTYENGDKCAEAGGKRRSVTTELRCCTQEEQAAMKEEEREEEEKENTEQQTKGGSSSSFSLTSKTLARLIKVEEHKTNVCTYTATVCTPLLCSDDVIQMEEGTATTTKQESSSNAAVADILKKFGMNDIASVINDAVADATAAASSSSSSSSSGNSIRSSSSSSSSSSSVIPATAMFDVNQSIRQLLVSTLGHKCLQKNDGWWRYELCHTKRVRQFHAGTKIDPVTGNTQMVVETEHLLGLYNHTSTTTSLSNKNNNKKTTATRNRKQQVSEEDNSVNDLLFPLDYPDSEEIEHMEHPKTSLATFTMEYTGGDMCDNSDDVKDESLKQVARATTVKFSCGKTYELKRVNEDSTCHYVFHVSVPDLCRHPLFVAPVVKEQIIKCLPVVNDMILDDE